MTSGNATTTWRNRSRALLLAATLALPALAATPAAEGAVDADWILRQLAQPLPAATAFVELRGSRMLKRPLSLSGEYRRPDADTLVREVRTPYAETTTIRGGQATIARAGRAPRTFSLSRAPELEVLQGSFGALLSGDRRAIETQFVLQAGGTTGDWRLSLTPRDAQAAKRLQAIVLRGRGDELRCIETRPTQGEAQPTLLASAARAAGDVASIEAALRLCREPPR